MVPLDAEFERYHVAVAGSFRVRRDLLTTLLRICDRILRRYMRIEPFCGDQCVLRLAPAIACHDVEISDGTVVRAGDAVSELHLWNEHLPRMPLRGPTIAWAIAMRRSVRRSLPQLAAHVEADPRFAQIQAFVGDITFAGCRRGAKLNRVARQYGFDLIQRHDDETPYLRDFVDGLFVCALTRAFNPAGLRHLRLTRRRYELWISKRTLIGRHLRPPAAAASPPAF